MLGWGTTYHVPILVGDRFAADLHMPMEFVFGGLTILMVVTALVAPRVGVLADRRGPRPFLCAGSVLAAVGLAALSQSVGTLSYAFAWLLIGLAHGFMLGNAALVALARVAGPQARQAISWMMLATAVNTFLFYPVTSFLADAVGWRAMCLIYAGAHLCIGLPLLFTAGSLRAADSGRDEDQTRADDPERHGVLPATQRRGALALLMIAFTGNGLLGWGLSPNLVHLLGVLGMPAASAVFLASLHGPSQLSGRLIEFGYGERWSPLTMGVFAAAIAPLAFVTLMFSSQSALIAMAGVGLYGLSSGIISVVRASAPLHLFGRETYGATLGRITLPMNLASAVAPILFASLITRGGPALCLFFGALVAIVVVIVMMILSRQTRAALA